MLVSARSSEPRPPTQNRWEPAIQKFEEADKLAPPAKGGIVFVGASSIVRWNLEESFPDLKGVAVNRGFGGSEMADAARYASRVVVPYAPKVVVLYPGENDIARGVSAETVGAGFIRFYQTVHTALPTARIVAIGLKPTPVRWQFIDEMRDANRADPRLLRKPCRMRLRRRQPRHARRRRQAEARAVHRRRRAHDARGLQDLEPAGETLPDT